MPSTFLRIMFCTVWCIVYFAFPVLAKNLVLNHTFSKTIVTDDIWDGVDKDGNLRVHARDLAIMIEGSYQQNKPFGASPCWADVTGDGKPDLVVGDGDGFLWIFETKSGSRQFPPSFTQGRFVHTCMGQAMNIDVVDYNADGMNDVLVGTAEGAMQIVRNRGNGRFIDQEALPNYKYIQRENLRTRKPVDLSKSYQLVMKGDLPLCFGSYAAPRLVDWTRNNKNDLVVGEGSYSANSVYLFQNQGQNSNPDFTAAKRQWLAYGMGREHLSPAVGDLDGDGDLDLLVGDRLGKLTWYENNGINRESDTPYLIEPNPEPVLVGTSSAPCGEFPRPHLADVDRDGDLDLFLGCSDGRILISRNAGVRTKPEFSSAVPLKGVDLHKPRPTAPWPWHQFWMWFGNSAATHEIKDEADIETGIKRRFAHIYLRDGYFGNSTSFEFVGLKLKFNTPYSLSFEYRGCNVTIAAGVGKHGEQYVEGDTLKRGGGGGQNYPLQIGTEWRRFQQKFTLPKQVQASKDTEANCWVYFHLNEAKPDGYFDVTDIVLEETTP